MDQIKAEKRRRDKAQLSCNLCRRRKQRCDRQLPCASCSSRGLASSCSYPENTSSHKPRFKQTAPTAPSNLQQRLNHLESLIQVLAETPGNEDQKQPPPQSNQPRYCSKCSGSLDRTSPATDATQSERSDAGKLRGDEARMVYVGGAHWSAVLDEISSLRGLCQDSDNGSDCSTDLHSDHDSSSNAYMPQLAAERPRLLFGSHDPTVSIYDVLWAVPDRAAVDRLVIIYFNNLTLPHTFLHSGSFLRVYEEFWQDPANTPPLWLATLFGIMSLASQVEAAGSHAPLGNFSMGNSPLNTEAFRPKFLDQVVQCLVMGDYSKGGEYAVEALIHYMIMEHMRYPDVNTDTWLVMGIILRLGFRMGYHRDPSNFSSLTVLQQEIRRRVWAFLYAMDTMLSLQVGLPRTIKDELWDTRPPSNLLDTDITEDMTTLPPPRPDYEATPMLHLAAKRTMLSVIGTIADASMRVSKRHQPWTAVDEIQTAKELNHAYDSIPEKCKFDTLLGCIADKPCDILNRISVTMLLQKGLIMLNWHHVMQFKKHGSGSPGTAYNQSNEDHSNAQQGYKTCIAAARKVLEIQNMVETESRPGGILSPLWMHTSSIIKHEFLMSTIVLCTHMQRLVFGEGAPGATGDAGAEEYHEIEAALRRSYHIWTRLKGRSKDATRVTDLLGALFRKMDGGYEGLKTTDLMDDVIPDMDILGEFGLFHHLQDIEEYLGGMS